MPNTNDVERWQQQDAETSCMMPWSEMTYNLFSFLIDERCPRKLAMKIELYIFRNSWMPFGNRLEEAVNVFINTDGPDEAVVKLQQLLEKWQGQ